MFFMECMTVDDAMSVDSRLVFPLLCQRNKDELITEFCGNVYAIIEMLYCR